MCDFVYLYGIQLVNLYESIVLAVFVTQMLILHFILTNYLSSCVLIGINKSNYFTYSFNFVILRLDCHLKYRFLFLFHIKVWLGDLKLLWKIHSHQESGFHFILFLHPLQYKRRFYLVTSAQKIEESRKNRGGVQVVS